MDEGLNNPARNALPPGLSEEALAEAVERSGYPLQTVVAAALRDRDFYVQEEWSYVDSDIGGLRAADILAERVLYKPGERHRVYPGVALVIECKQSELPYVFFESQIVDDRLAFPNVAGLVTADIEITDDDALPGNYEANSLELFGLDNEPLIKTPVRCATFSKLARKGRAFELSGTEPYQGLVLPLLKAAEFFHRYQAPPESFQYFHPRLVFPVAVLSAPVVVAGSAVTGASPSLTPWVRIYRHESEQAPEAAAVNQRERLRGLDVVHADFLTSYLDDYVMPFARLWGKHAVRHGQVLADGAGYVPNYAELDDQAALRTLRPVSGEWIEGDPG